MFSLFMPGSPRKQVPRQRLRRFAPEHAPPPGAQGRNIEIAQPRDLVFKLASIDHHRSAAHRARRADFFGACRAPIVTIIDTDRFDRGRLWRRGDSVQRADSAREGPCCAADPSRRFDRALDRQEHFNC